MESKNQIKIAFKYSILSSTLVLSTLAAIPYDSGNDQSSVSPSELNSSLERFGSRLNVTAGKSTKGNVKVLRTLLKGSRGFSRPSILGLKGFTAPTIQNHNYLKSVRMLKISNKEQSKKTKIQMFVTAGIVLLLVLLMMLYIHYF